MSSPRLVPFITASLLVFVLMQAGCVARSAYDALGEEYASLEAESASLAEDVRRLTIERDSLEQQYIEAQESYEDERIARESLATNLTQVQQEADDLDQDLGAERIAHLQAAAALAAREAEIAAMQSTYDELVTDLESEVSAGQIEIERLREGLRLNVSDDVLFASGSAELDQTGREVLEKVAVQLIGLGDFIEVRGHTDDRRIRGALARRYPTNWELAAARAARVVRLLEEKGVPSDRLAVVSLGPNDPIAPNDSAENRAMNRRIEIRLEPMEPRPKAIKDGKAKRTPPVSSAPTEGRAPAEAETEPPTIPAARVERPTAPLESAGES